MWLGWSRCMMGLMSSPYVAIKQTHLGMEVIKGERTDDWNPLHWHEVILNLPGLETYTPLFPWVRRIRDGYTARGLPCYVDDLRSVGESQELCWQIGHKVSSMMSYLGCQVTTRKTRPPSQTPGAWSGIIAFADSQGVGVCCAQDKWDKARGYIQLITEELE